MDVWSKVLQQIRQRISKPNFETWFADTNAEVTKGVMTVKTKNDFMADWLEQRYITLISEAVREVTGRTYVIQFSYPQQVQKRVHRVQEEENHHHLEQRVANLGEQIKALTELVKKQDERIKTLENRVLDEQNDSPINPNQK